VRILSYIVLLTIILLGVSFATLNSEMVTVNYYVSQKTMPLSLLLVSVFAIGCLLGLLVGLGIVIRLKLKTYRLRQRLKLAEKEVANLRAIPLQDRH
jgi:lipopolysaccharide assembly protein A